MRGSRTFTLSFLCVASMVTLATAGVASGAKGERKGKTTVTTVPFYFGSGLGGARLDGNVVKTTGASHPWTWGSSLKLNAATIRNLGKGNYHVSYDWRKINDEIETHGAIMKDLVIHSFGK